MVVNRDTDVYVVVKNKTLQNLSLASYLNKDQKIRNELNRAHILLTS